MVFTGGPLNYLNGQCGASDPSKSVHVMSLIREHNPQTPDDLYEEIEHHYEEECECGIKSGGTVEDFGEWLYEAQFDEWGEERFSLEDCIQWEYDLFVMQSLKGRDLEEEARDLLEADFTVRDVEDFADDEYRVDLVVESAGEQIAGIQVKPESYQQVRDAVKHRNREAHSEIEEPVFYLYYDYDTEQFINSDRIMRTLREHAGDDE